MEFSLGEFTGIPKDCSEIDDYQTQLFIVLLRKTENLHKWSPYFKKCQAQFPIEYKLIATKSLMVDEIVKTLKQIKSKKFNYTKIKKIIDQRKSSIYKNYVDNFLQIDNFKIIKNKDTRRAILAYKSDSSYLGLIAQLKLALVTRNNGWGNSLLTKLIKIGPLYLAEQIDRTIAFEQRGVLSKEIIQLLKELWTSSLDIELKKMYLQKLSTFDDDDVSEFTDKLFGAMFFQEKVFKLNDYRYGISFPRYWYDRLSSLELRKELLFEFYESPAVNKMVIGQYSLFKHYMPAQGKFRKSVTINVRAKYHELSLIEVESILLASESSVVKKMFASSIPEFKKPLFTVKKNLYLKMINKSRCGTYCMFKLLDLGYENSQMLWWLL